VSRIRVSAALLLVGVAIVVAYARSFDVPFQFDDHDQIVNNPALRRRTAAELLSWGRARLIPYLTFALNFVAGELDPFGYHAVNLAIHVATAALVFFLCLALCDTPRLRDTPLARQRLLFATGAALLFGLHPIQVQAVTYVVQRVAAMAAMFYLASVYLYVRGLLADSPQRQRLAYAGAALMALAAFFSKENALSLPLALLLVRLLFFPRPRASQVAKLTFGFGLLALAIPLTWFLLWKPPRSAPPVTTVTERVLSVIQAGRPSAGPIDYFLTECTVLPRYLGLVFYPRGLNVDHDVVIQHGLTLPVTAGAALLGGLLVFAVAGARRWPAVSFAVLWFFVTLSVESSFLAIADPMVEHRMYLPMAGIAIGIAGAFCALQRRLPIPAAAAGVVVVAVLLLLTMRRNEVWLDPLTLWRDALAKSPNKARVSANVGIMLHQAGKAEEAIPYYCRALEIEPDNSRYRAYLDVALSAKLERLMEEDPSSDEIEMSYDDEGNLVVAPKDPCRKP